MSSNFLVQNKIIWRGKILADLTICFYPSFYKNILKREQLFMENFKFSFEDATVEKLKSNFIPIYRTEIMNRENFNLERTKIINSITERVKKNPLKYKFLFIHSNDGELFGATLFSIVDDKLQLAFRAHRRDINVSALKHKASLDYWGEKLVREYGAKMKLVVFSHGKDTHPYNGRSRIGLALYKLKVGTRPKVPKLDNPEKPIKNISLDESFLFSQKEPVVFFDSPDENEFYQNCFLYYPKNSLHPSFINEFKLVSEWAGLTFKSTEY
jgi:hypothetical protein